MRGIGVVTALRDFLPEIVAPVFALITQLGDVWFVFAVLFVLYWGNDRLPIETGLSRSRGAFVLALALGGLALTVTLKQLFGFPRPPMPDDAHGLRYVPDLLRGPYINAATASGYGFPSGHAITTTVVWGGLAAVLDTTRPRRRWFVAGSVITLVCLARVVLGVHYVIDVIVGVAIGVTYLALAFGFARERPGAMFWLATAIAGVGVVLAGTGVSIEAETFDNASALGGTLGAAVAWQLLGNRIPRHLTSRRAGALAVAVGLPVLGGGFGAIYAIEPQFLPAVLATAAVLAGAVALPVVLEMVENHLDSTDRETSPHTTGQK